MQVPPAYVGDINCEECYLGWLKVPKGWHQKFKGGIARPPPAEAGVGGPALFLLLSMHSHGVASFSMASARVHTVSGVCVVIAELKPGTRPPPLSCWQKGTYGLYWLLTSICLMFCWSVPLHCHTTAFDSGINRVPRE